MLPAALKALLLDDLRAWDKDEPIFDDLPGWSLEAKDPAALRRAARAGYSLELDVEEVYPLFWQVFDLRQQGKTDREIAQELWQEVLQTAPDVARQRVYDYLDCAHKLIGAAYSPTTPKKEQRRRRGGTFKK